VVKIIFLGSARLGSDISRLRLNKTPARLDSAQLFYGSAFAAPASVYRSR